MPVNNTHKDYDKFKDKWQRSRDVAAGSDEIKQQGEKYLPRLRDQSDDSYKAYKLRATFYNATYRVLAALLGMLFRKKPAEKLPASLQDALDNINLKGDNLLTFAMKVAYELLTPGRVGILVDHTRAVETAEQDVTVAQAEASGLRPTLQMYCTESVINWRTTVVNNKTVLGLVVLKESVTIIDQQDRYKESNEDRYRVLELENGRYVVSVWKVVEGKDVLVTPPFAPLMNGKPFEEIPFYMLGPGGLQIDVEEPPMIDLVDLNLAHFRVSADYEHGCHWSALPTAVVSGYNATMGADGKTPEKLYVGSETAWTFTDPGAKAEFLEFTGQGLQPIEKNLDRKESQMAILGARMLAPEKKTAETATTAAIHRTGENAILSSVANSVSEALTKALTLFAEWAGNKAECDYQLNRDFMPFLLDARFVTALVAAVIQGTLPYESFFEIMQRGDLIRSDMTVEQAVAAIEADKQARAAQAADAAAKLADATGGPTGGPAAPNQPANKKPATKS